MCKVWRRLLYQQMSSGYAVSLDVVTRFTYRMFCYCSKRRITLRTTRGNYPGSGIIDARTLATGRAGHTGELRLAGQTSTSPFGEVVLDYRAHVEHIFSRRLGMIQAEFETGSWV